MKSNLRQVFRSPSFVVGFGIFLILLLVIIIYPLMNPGNPLLSIGLGNFARPGTYVSLYDSLSSDRSVLRLPEADARRAANLLSNEDKVKMAYWLELAGNAEGVDASDSDSLITAWHGAYDPALRPKGMTKADRNYYERLNKRLLEASKAAQLNFSEKDPATGELIERGSVGKDDYVNVRAVANVKTLPLGTDNFGRDVLKELVSAAGTSLVIGLIAGLVATLLGLLLGLFAGYLGGWVDDLIMFFTNIFTVIPGFVLLILISYSIGQDQRGASTVAVVIGLTSWVWTARSVRSQVISLRNRDHVNLSKLSGHSVPRIILKDILPYIASYVVMAFILQVSSGILAEAQLSLLGLGPKTTEVPTLGLMMNWAMVYSAHLNGSWWAYFPVILVIAFISFSLNLMNTGLDQVFNPQLRY